MTKRKTAVAKQGRTATLPPAPRRAAPRATGIKVRAKVMGYYDDKRRRPGDVFVVGAEEFGSKGVRWPAWMERVDPDTPERITTGREALREENRRTVAENQALRHGGPTARPRENQSTGADPATGDLDPLGDD